jgi:hypothetical protein
MTAFALAASSGARRSVTLFAGFVAALAALLAIGFASATDDAALPAAAEQLAGLPLAFEPNRGQLAREIDFYAAGRGHALAASPAGVTVTTTGKRPRRLLELTLAGANADATPVGERRLPGTVNYLTGADAKEWRRDVPTYAHARFRDVYPGVDAVYYGKGRLLEYDFVVAAGADPSTISFQLRGTGAARITRGGELVVPTREGAVTQRRPIAYQIVGGERRPVAVAYERRDDGRIGFRLGAYDPAKRLVIDPTVVFSTYLDYVSPDGGNAVTTDSVGNVYLTGRGGPGLDAMVMKINAAGTAIEYTTYVGGTSFDSPDLGTGIAVDPNGFISVGGNAWTSDFPLVNAFQTTKASVASNDADGFVFRLRPDGKTLVYSTYLGGSDRDDPYSIAVDSAGNAYVTGYTESPIHWGDGTVSPRAFPTTPGSYQPSIAGDNDGFLSKIDPNGKLVYSTYLGGVWEDLALDVAVDAQGSAYITGVSDSSDYPTTSGAYRTANPNTNGDAFVAKFSPDGSRLVYSTLLGGLGEEIAWGIAVDGNANAYVTGYTYSFDYPTAGAFQAASGGAPDAFLTKLDAAGSGLVYSTYLGGSNGDLAESIALDGSGAAYVAGYTSSANFPVLNAVQSTHAGGTDAFVTKVDPSGASLAYSTFWGAGQPGGIGADYGESIAVDASGNAFLAGTTYNPNFPLVNPLKSSLTKANHPFLVKLAEGTGATFHRISGIVDDGVGNGMAGVTITLSGSKTASVVTSDVGAYSFTGLPAGGTYTVTASKAGSTFSPESHTYSSLGADQQANFVRAATATHKISGRVTTSTGAPHVGVKVTLSGGASASATTDSLGNYVFTGLAAGANYTVTPSLAGWTFTPSSRTYNALAADQVGDFTAATTASPTYRISGRVATSAGAAVGGVRVVLSGGASATTTTDSFGNYAFTGLAGGRNYTVTPSLSGYAFTPASRSYSALAANQVANFTAAKTATVDTVSVTRAEYRRDKQELRVEATSTSSSATLRAYVTSSGALIGTLSNLGGGKYGATLRWSTNPQNVTVRSSLGGSASRTVSAG